MPEALSSVAFRVFLLYWRAKPPGINCGPACRRELCRGCREIERKVYSALRPAKPAPFAPPLSHRRVLGSDRLGRMLHEWVAVRHCGRQCAGTACRGCREANTYRGRAEASGRAMNLAWEREHDRAKLAASRKATGLADLEMVRRQWARVAALEGLA